MQLADFWAHFCPVLSPSRAADGLAKVCLRLCRNELQGALEDACAMGFWAHALAVPGA